MAKGRKKKPMPTTLLKGHSIRRIRSIGGQSRRQLHGK